MLGHSSLQMIFTRYSAWIPKKNRNDGSAFMASIGKSQENIRAANVGSSAEVK